MGRLPDAGRAPLRVRTLEGIMDYDLYDLLAELDYSLAPRTRRQFARSGTDGLENPQGFETPDVTRAGGLPALRALGQPAEILRQTKERLFAA